MVVRHARRDRQTGRQTDRPTDWQTDRQTYRQTNRQADRQADREADRQTPQAPRHIRPLWYGDRKLWQDCFDEKTDWKKNCFTISRPFANCVAKFEAIYQNDPFAFLTSLYLSGVIARNWSNILFRDVSCLSGSTNTVPPIEQHWLFLFCVWCACVCLCGESVCGVSVCVEWVCAWREYVRVLLSGIYYTTLNLHNKLTFVGAQMTPKSHFAASLEPKR